MSQGNTTATATLKKHISTKSHHSELGAHCDTNSERQFLTIGPAIPVCETITTDSVKKRPKRFIKNIANENVLPDDGVFLQSFSDGTTNLSRTLQEKEKNPDRINLDRRGLTVLPRITGETKLRLLSLQHNLINNLDGFLMQDFPFLVFLDVYDNQVEKIHSLDKLKSLRVLLLGKNRIKKIEGLHTLVKIEILDLHGNQIQHVTGLSLLSSLKILNLAGNQIVTVGVDDLRGLHCLQELNLKRNKLKKLYGFGETACLQKLYLSGNDIQSIDDMRSIAKLKNLKEITIDNNPVSLITDCASFLVSYLPQLIRLNFMLISESAKKTAMAWRRNKENSDPTFMDLSSDLLSNEKREEVISNAKINWELICSQTKGLSAKTSVGSSYKCGKPQPEHDFFITPFVKQKEKKSTTTVHKNNRSSQTFSLETENSQNTSSSNSSVNDFFRLPPILIPIVSKMEQINDSTKDSSVFSGSLSSVNPNVNSSPCSLIDTSNSSQSSNTESLSAFEESENEITEQDSLKEANEIEQINSYRKSSLLQTDNTILPKNVDSMSANTSSSGINISGTITEEDLSSNLKNVRSIKSATHCRSAPTKIISRATTAKLKKPPSLPVNLSGKIREQGGDYLIEINDRHLNIYGQGALRYIDKQWNINKAGDVDTVSFNYTNFSGITTVLNKIKQKFPNAEHFVFKETNIYCLGQINAFAEIQGLSSLHIDQEGNPITEKEWQDYAIYRLSHWGLRILNGKEISDADINRANVEYRSLSDLILYLLPESLLQPLLLRLHLENNYGNIQNCKKWLMLADVALKDVVTKEALQWKKMGVGQEEMVFRQRAKQKLEHLLDDMCDAVNKIRLLDKQWPVILQEIICNTLLDFSQLDIYMKTKIQELK